MARELLYIFDSLCGWCYGFSKTIQELDNDPKINITAIHGSLYANQIAPPLENLKSINKKISALTGAEFGSGFEQLVSAKNYIFDSTVAGRGFNALKMLGAEQVQAVVAMQRAYFLAGKSLNKLETYQEIGESFGIKAEQVEQMFESEASLDAVRKGQLYAKDLGVKSYPTLLAQTPAGLLQVAQTTSTAKEIKKTLKRLV